MRTTSRLALAAVLALGAACGSSSPVGTTGPTADQACTAVAQAQCTLRTTCSTNNYLNTRTYGDTATCVARLHDSCVNALAATNTGNSPANVMACAAAYPGIRCTDYLNGTNLPAACQTQVGTLAIGAACRFSAQCQSTFCNVITGTNCGVCAAPPTVGTACNGPGATATCGGHGLSCADAMDNATTLTAGTCATLVTATGATCDATHPCGAGLSCTPMSATAMNRTCQTAGAAAGAACGTVGTTNNPGCDNNLGLYCNGVSHTCQPFITAQPGTACGVGTDGNFTNCAGNGDCMGYTNASPHGTCRAAVSDGAGCAYQTGPNCGAASTCVRSGTGTAGMCAFPTASLCH